MMSNTCIKCFIACILYVFIILKVLYMIDKYFYFVCAFATFAKAEGAKMMGLKS